MEAVPWTLADAAFATTGARVRAAAVPHHNPRNITRLQQVAQQRRPFAAGCPNKPLRPFASVLWQQHTQLLSQQQTTQACIVGMLNPTHNAHRVLAGSRGFRHTKHGCNKQLLKYHPQIL